VRWTRSPPTKSIPCCSCQGQGRYLLMDENQQEIRNQVHGGVVLLTNENKKSTLAGTHLACIAYQSSPRNQSQNATDVNVGVTRTTHISTRYPYLQLRTPEYYVLTTCNHKTSHVKNMDLYFCYLVIKHKHMNTLWYLRFESTPIQQPRASFPVPPPLVILVG
jgi:hypothetical protein